MTGVKWAGVRWRAAGGGGLDKRKSVKFVKFIRAWSQGELGASVFFRRRRVEIGIELR